MIYTLPRKISFLEGDMFLPNGSPLYEVRRIPGGAFIYNLRGGTIAQIFRTDNGARISIADLGSIDVTVGSDGVKIARLIVEHKGHGRSLEPVEYIFHGNYRTSHYQIYEKKPGEIKPELIITVAPHPINEKTVNARVEDGVNVLRATLMILAISLL